LSEFLAQLGPLARGSDFDGWANILFLAIVAVFWLVGGLIKAMGGKKQQRTPPAPADAAQDRRRPGETWQERLMRKAEEWQRRLEEEAAGQEAPERRQPTREPATRPSPAPEGNVTVRRGRRGESILVYERPKPEPPTQREQQAAQQRAARRAVAAAGQHTTLPKPELVRRERFEPMVSGLSPVMAEPTETLDPGRVQLKAQRESAGFEPDALIDYSDPDALKKAILHYEILGKPLALREASDATQVF